MLKVGDDFSFPCRDDFSFPCRDCVISHEIKIRKNEPITIGAGFKDFLIVYPLPREMIQFDLRVCSFKWVAKKNKQLESAEYIMECHVRVLFVSRCHPADSEVISSTLVIPKVMGTHFFSPANVMQLLENVRTSNLAEFLALNKNWVVVSIIFYFHRYLGKIPILTNSFQVG